jgi:DNA-binding MarR family transcriptional regulator
MRTEPESKEKAMTLNCARQVGETVPQIMRLIRSSVRKQGGLLSVPQIRLLSLLSRQPGASISEVAADLDVTIPTASALVDRLVKKHIIHRKDDPTERRRAMLTVTPEGKEILEQSRSQTQAFLAHLLATESAEKISKISEGLALLASAAEAFRTEKKMPNVKST